MEDADKIRAAFAYMGPRTQAGLTLEALAKGAGIVIKEREAEIERLKFQVEREHECAGELQAGLVKQYGEFAAEMDAKEAELKAALLQKGDLNIKVLQLEAEVAKWRAELNGSENAHADTLRLVERMQNVVDAACALESFFGHDDLNSAYRNRREATDAFVKAVAAWKTWTPEKRKDESRCSCKPAEEAVVCVEHQIHPRPQNCCYPHTSGMSCCCGCHSR